MTDRRGFLFTQGPWHVVGDNVESLDTGGLVATVYRRRRPRDDEGEEEAANARLIASAPALAYVLQTLLDDPDDEVAWRAAAQALRRVKGPASR